MRITILSRALLVSGSAVVVLACGGRQAQHAAQRDIGSAPRIVARAADPVAVHRDRLLVAASSVELVVDGVSTTVDTPNHPMIDGLRRLVIVNVFPDGVEIAGIRAVDADDVVRIAGEQSPHTVFLVRAEGPTPVGSVVDAISTLHRVPAAHVVLGVTSPRTALRSWDDCPFPAASDAAKVDHGVALVQITLDAARHASIVDVHRADEPGFGGAAALCLARRTFPVGSPGANGEPFRIRFER